MSRIPSGTLVRIKDTNEIGIIKYYNSSDNISILTTRGNILIAQEINLEIIDKNKLLENLQKTISGLDLSKLKRFTSDCPGCKERFEQLKKFLQNPVGAGDARRI